MSLSSQDEALKQAVENGDLAAVKTLIGEGANPLYQEGDAIRTMAIHGYVDILNYYVQDLVNAGHSAIMGYLEEAVITAVIYGQYSVVEYLIGDGHVAISLPSIEDALYRAAEYGHMNIIEYLRSHGSTHLEDVDDGALLITAVDNGHLDLVAYLLNYIDVNVQDGLALLQAASIGDLPIVELLVSKGANLSLTGEASLIQAAGGGHLEVVVYLVGLGVTSTEAAIVAAANAGHQDVVNYLTDGTLPVDEEEELRRLMREIEEAVETGNISAVVGVIMGSNDHDFAGEYALMASIAYDQMNVVKHLIETMGVSPTFDGNLPVIYAAYYGKLEMVKYLISRGADGSMALDAANEGGHQDVIEYLSEKYSQRKRRVMTSFCRPAQPCPAPATGYNVCIENDTEVDQVYLFGDLTEAGAFVTSQSVTVPRNTSICYRILSPLGTPVILQLEDPLGNDPPVVAGAFTCSVHITTRTVVGIDPGTPPDPVPALVANFFTTLDCSPCPCPCEFSCAPERKACESVTGTGLGLGFGITKKLVELCMDTHSSSKTVTHGCPDTPRKCPVSDVAGSDSWIFADN